MLCLGLRLGGCVLFLMAAPKAFGFRHLRMRHSFNEAQGELIPSMLFLGLHCIKG
jgi:hypothetical protein